MLRQLEESNLVNYSANVAVSVFFGILVFLSYCFPYRTKTVIAYALANDSTFRSSRYRHLKYSYGTVRTRVKHNVKIVHLLEFVYKLTGQ